MGFRGTPAWYTTSMDRTQLANFLRTRREHLQPEDVGLPRGVRRRAEGLRREEVAALCGMSVDYYCRLEQQRGPQPSEAMLAAMAHGLHLSLDERDHLFRLAGHHAPYRTRRSDHINPGLMRILDRLMDTPAQVMNDLGETLRQTPLAVELFGIETQFTGMERSGIFRWFADPASRWRYAETEHELHGRILTAHLRSYLAREGPTSRVAAMVNHLLDQSAEFAHLWNAHEIGLLHQDLKRLVHPDLGVLELYCQALFDLDQAQALMVFTATPGTESATKLRRLAELPSTAEHLRQFIEESNR